MYNGCCKKCMKAFSKTGRSCLCQVPHRDRKNALPPSGCIICGCHGYSLIIIKTNLNFKLNLAGNI